MKRYWIFVFLALFSFIFLYGSFKPEEHRYYPSSKYGKFRDNIKLTDAEIKSAIYKSIIETDKKKYISGEPILYKILVKALNNKNGWTLDSVNFIIKGDNTVYKSNLTTFERRLYRFLNNYRYIVAPVAGYRFPLKGKIYHGAYANIFTYFEKSPFLQFQIKPGKYWIKFNLKRITTNCSEILPCSTRIEIDSIPDSEKLQFHLLKKDKYKEIFTKHPESVYAPYAKFRYLLKLVKEYANALYNDNKVSQNKYGEEIKQNYYELVRDYPDYAAGEVQMMEYIFQEVIYCPILGYHNRIVSIDTLLTPETKEYFDKFGNLKDSNMAIFLKWRLIDKWVYFKKMAKIKWKDPKKGELLKTFIKHETKRLKRTVGKKEYHVSY